jgi:cell division protein FtsB
MRAEDATPADRPLSPRRRRVLLTSDRRVRRRRLITYSIFAASLVLMTHALLGENGYFATLRAQREHAQVEAALTRLRMENQRLREESRRLREEPAALEEAARRDLGLVRPGETLVVVKKAQPQKNETPR